MAKKLKNICRKREDNIAEGRHGVLSSQMIVCVCPAYNPHNCQSGHSNMLDACILGYVWAVKYPDPWG